MKETKEKGRRGIKIEMAVWLTCVGTAATLSY